MLRRTMVLAAALALSLSAHGDDKEKAKGLAKGESCNPFQVLDVTGPSKGKQLCYV